MENTTERAMTRGLLAAGCTSRIDGTGVSLGEPWTGAEGLALGPDAPGHQAPCSRGAQFSARKRPIVECIVPTDRGDGGTMGESARAEHATKQSDAL